MAEASGGQERTEQPTARRRAEALRQGQVARSTDLSAAVVLLVGTAVLVAYAGPGFTVFAHRVLQESTHALAFRELGPDGMVGMVRLILSGFLAVFVPFALGVVAVTVLVNRIQSRGVMTWEPVMPKLSHIDPVQGLRRLFSSDAVITGVKSVLKLAAVGLVTYVVLSRTLPQLASLSDAGAGDVAAIIQKLLFRLAVLLGMAALVLGALDYLWQHYRMEQNLRMTRQEVVYDHRDSEGDPHVKARMMSLARANARRRMLSRVPTADVVIVNPTEIAVALKYDQSVAPAPLVVAMGQRKLAQRIRDIANRSEIPVVENRPVARALLATATVGQPIPPALYAAVAEILAFVYRRRGRRPHLVGSSPARSAS